LTGPELLAENLKKATEAMDELAKKTRLEWYELEKLNKLRGEVKDLKAADAAEKNVASATSALSEGEKAVGSGFGKAVAESGGANAFDEFKGVLNDSKDAKGLVYNEAKGRLTSVDDAARDMFDAALKGDKVSRDAIRKALAGGSRFASNIEAFSPEAAKRDEQIAADDDADIASGEADRKRKKEDRKNARANEKALEKLYEDMDEDNVQAGKRQKKEAIDQAGQLTQGQGFGGQVDRAFVRNALNSGGDLKQAAADLVEQITSELQGRGMGAKDARVAAEDIAQKHAAKLGDELSEKAMNPAKQESVQHVGSADYARSIEAGGSKGIDSIAANTEAMKEHSSRS